MTLLCYIIMKLAIRLFNTQISKILKYRIKKKNPQLELFLKY